MALVWTIILLWQETFKSCETSTSSSVFSTSLEPPIVSKMERTLLDWCRQSVSSNEISETVQGPLSQKIVIQNFTSSFSDGIAFLYILKRFHPQVVDESTVTRMQKEPKRLLEYVFQQFEKLGIPRLLDPEDFETGADSNKGIDKKSVMTYVMCIFRKLHVQGPNVSSEQCDKNSIPKEDNSNNIPSTSESKISAGKFLRSVLK